MKLEPFSTRQELSKFITGLSDRTIRLEDELEHLRSQKIDVDEYILANSLNDPLARLGEGRSSSITDGTLYQVMVKAHMNVEEYQRVIDRSEAESRGCAEEGAYMQLTLTEDGVTYTIFDSIQ